MTDELIPPRLLDAMGIEEEDVEIDNAAFCRFYISAEILSEDNPRKLKLIMRILTGELDELFGGDTA